jgi:hypothetical protein
MQQDYCAFRDCSSFALLERGEEGFDGIFIVTLFRLCK